jgi:hypothetical protein
MEQVEDAHLVLEHLISTCLRKVLEEGDYRLPDAVLATENGLLAKAVLASPRT